MIINGFRAGDKVKVIGDYGVQGKYKEFYDSFDDECTMPKLLTTETEEVITPLIGTISFVRRTWIQDFIIYAAIVTVDTNCGPRSIVVELNDLELIKDNKDDYNEIIIKNNNKNNISKVNILGTEYTVIESNSDNHPKLDNLDGYCDTSIKVIVINDMKDVEDDILSLEDIDAYKSKVIRHEIIHAFLYESGLSNNSSNQWAVNEEIIDWIAIQLPKINKVYNEITLI